MSAEQDIESLVGEWLTIPDIAEKLDVIVTRVHNYIKDQRLVALRIDGVRKVPAAFFTDTGILGSVRGTVIVLADAGFSDEEILRWLFTEDDTLPGRPIDALHRGHKSEIRRRAHALAW